MPPSKSNPIDDAFEGIASAIEDIDLTELLATAETEPQPAPTSTRATRRPIPLSQERRHDSRIERQRFTDARRISAAADILAPLPTAGAAAHVVLSGNFNAWDFVPALASLIAPAPVDELVISTLSYSQRNADGLFSLLDSGQVKATTFLVSKYFEASDPAIYEHLKAGLVKRGQRIAAHRVHCKIILVRVGRTFYTFEMSANLRSCNNLEQATIFNDAALFDFHKTWIDDVFRTADSADAPTADDV